MLKKIIAYQRLLLNSIPPINMNSQNISQGLLYGFAVFIMFLINMSIFMGNSIDFSSIYYIAFPIISVWMINRIIYGDHRLFDTVPVSRKYTVLNIFLLSVVIVVILFILLNVSGAAFLGIIVGIIYLVDSKIFSQSPPESAVYQIIDTTKGDILMVCVLLTILFAATAITLIRSEKLRLCSFGGLSIIGYSFLILLKISMPISPNSGKVEFLESFSIMPEGNTILLCLASATIITCITSVFIGYKLYVTGPKDIK
ncbi:MAG: hypothetical protein H7Y18_03865 [Clostridiaceae bacterium]|nr:hypothetical protein [Clostridiaceae bacterium]